MEKMELLSNDSLDIGSLAETNITLANQLRESLKAYAHVSGTQRIERQICQEIKFLQKKLSTNDLTINHILGSNLVHFNHLIAVLKRTVHIQHVDHPVKMDGQPKALIRIDIVSDAGATWIKVIARNPKAISDGVNGEASFGTKSIFDHARSYIEAANVNTCHFRPPKVIFDFSSSICPRIARELVEMGVHVHIDGDASTKPVDAAPAIRKLNLDITTLLAYVSAQTNGSNRWKYTDPYLTQQAARERSASVKAFLDEAFLDKELIACETAISSFREIINTLGGANEKERAECFIRDLNALPDLTTEEEQAINNQMAKLKMSGQIKLRALKIFLFGLHHKAVTVTSNEAFLRSAKMQGLNIPCILHEARALTEIKEETAEPIS